MVSIENDKNHKERLFKNAVKITHDIIRQVVEEGSVVVDATVGKGNDTAFLAQLVGRSGKVYGFDIQDKAIEATEKKLSSMNLLDRVILIKDSHEKIDSLVNEQIDLAVFNLGYLPGGDHNIITKSHSTLAAINKIIEKLNKFGLIIVVIYSGHDGGMEEKRNIEYFASKLDQNQFTVLKLDFINQINNPPNIICIEKK